MDKYVVVSNVSKSFKLPRKQQRLEPNKGKYKLAVNDISFEARKGQIYGLLGPNGAGKTTTLRILASILKAEHGSIFIDQIDATKNPEIIRTKTSFLTSELKLENNLTPNYLFNFFSDLYGVSYNKRAERKEMLFDKFEIDKYKEEKVINLSTGMKQKVSIACSLVHDPMLIIFDEPTNGLDILSAKVVTDFLLSMRDEGKCIILSTHIFSLVEKLCDRVGIMINGKMVYEDDLKQIQSLENKFFETYFKEVGTVDEK